VHPPERRLRITASSSTFITTSFDPTKYIIYGNSPDKTVSKDNIPPSAVILEYIEGKRTEISKTNPFSFPKHHQIMTAVVEALLSLGVTKNKLLSLEGRQFIFCLSDFVRSRSKPF
jgi:hypothetical protein